MKKIIYICNTRFPTEKAHGLSTVKLCEAFADEGYQVDLVIPRLWRKSAQDLFSFYKIKKNFTVRTVPCIDFLGMFFIPQIERVTFLIQILSFSLFSYFFIRTRYSREERSSAIFLSHDYMPLYASSFAGARIFYDIHHFPGSNFMYKRLMKKCFGFAVQTKWKIAELSRIYSVALSKIVYWPNGTDVHMFGQPISKEDARTRLGLPMSENIVVYTGQLFGWKGVGTLVRAVTYLDKGTLLYIVGGTAHDVERMKSEITEAHDSRIAFIGPQPHDEVVQWLKAADVLVLPNTGKQKVSLYYTSPMKLFEYMAAARPIVATKIPSIQEILNDGNSVLVNPDDSQDMARGIEWTLHHSVEAGTLALQAQKDVQQYTWQERARKILTLFTTHE